MSNFENKKEEEEDIHENHPDRIKFHKKFNLRKEELLDTLHWLIQKKGLELKKSIKYDTAMEYFRGVKFYLIVMQNPNEVLERIPSIVQDGLITKMTSINDVTKLGQMMMYCGILSRSRAHINLQLKKDSIDYKRPKYHMKVEPIFGPAGVSGNIDCYVVEIEQDTRGQKVYLGITLALVLAFLFFDHWPYWLQDYTWQAFWYYILFYIGVGGARLILWTAFYHFGLEFWLFPKWRDSYKPHKFMWPLASIEARSDMTSLRLNIFRITSLAFFAHTIYQFTRDEKAVEDLKDFTQQGLTDLLDYGSEWNLNLELANSTETQQERSFKDKVKDTMDVDVDITPEKESEDYDNTFITDEDQDTTFETDEM